MLISFIPSSIYEYLFVDSSKELLQMFSPWFSRCCQAWTIAKAILILQGRGIKGAIITSNKQQQLCVISCLATDVANERIYTRRSGRKWEFLI